MLGGQQRGAASPQPRHMSLLRIAALSLVCALGLPLLTARAEDATVPAEVLIVLASGEDGTVDASFRDPSGNGWKLIEAR